MMLDMRCQRHGIVYDLAFQSEMKHVVNIILQFRQKAAKQNL